MTVRRLELPEPTADELAHSQRVRGHVLDAIARAGGWLPFARYVELVLYAPGLGYYSAGARKFGAEGDFVTSPEISPVFGRCLATQCADVLRALGGGDVVELGGGTGRLAADLLAALESEGAPPARYRLLEVSADLRERQRAQVATLPAHLRDRVEWLDAPPPEPWRGVLLANEVLDALPFERFRRTADGVEQLGVEADGERFRWSARTAPPPLCEAVTALEVELGTPFPAGHASEACLALDAWLPAVTRSLEAGLALFVDYGFPRREYYAPERDDGTLACFYRHRRHDDPFLHPGLQDVTAWVDFTRAAEAGVAAGFEVGGYTTQAHFLLATGFDRHVQALRAELEAAGDPGGAALAAHRAARLVLPGELGERFKCLGLVRGLAHAPRGFGLRDLTASL